MAKDLSNLDAAGGALYDAGFADGVASVQAAPAITPADVDAAVAKAKNDLKSAVAAAVSAEDADLQSKIAAL